MKIKKAMNLTKQIICIIIILMLCNFIIPNYSYAADTEEGGSLMDVIAQFLCIIPDAVINLLQDMFVTPERIQIDDENYSIKYSPGIIFSGQVPALDINFIKPSNGKTVDVVSSDYISLIDALDFQGAKMIDSAQCIVPGNNDSWIKQIKNKYKSSEDIDVSKLEGSLKSSESEAQTVILAGKSYDANEIELQQAWYNEDKSKVYVIVEYVHTEQTKEFVAGEVVVTNITTKTNMLFELDSKEALENATEVTDKTNTVIGTVKYESSAAILQPIVATWYNALRKIALVGLLSALVYIGIRIVLTSTSAKDKAKYKNMLKDWLIALCLLFTLHYIMSITITVVDKINEVVKASSIAANGEDILMTSIRNKILNGENWSAVLADVVIYLVLVVYTIIYTIQYIRRLIYIAFLTMIAPLITLTYPLDKIKDSKSQAFDMWIKDYVFFSLIQVVHLLIYYIFLGSAIDLSRQGNWLYAIVAIGFITPAEKLIKKMFGFEKSKTLGALGAGATGALVMNAIQKIPHMGSKQSSGGKQTTSKSAEPTKGVRTVGTNPFVTLSVDAESNASRRTRISNNTTVNQTTSETLNSSDSGLKTQNSPANILPKGESVNSNTNVVNASNKETKTSQDEGESKLAQLLKKRKLLKGSSQTSSQLKFKQKIKGAKAVAKKYFPSVLGGTIRVMAQSTGVVIGFSTAVANGGEFSDIGNGIVAGAAAGNGVANMTIGIAKRTTQIPEAVNDVVDTWREGAYGKEVAQNAKFDRIFRNSSEYKDLRDSSGLSDTEFDEKVQKMLDSGITDAKRMKTILKNHKFDPTKYNIEDAIKYSNLAEKCSENLLYDKVKFIRFCQDRKLNLSEEELIELRKNIINFK